MCVFVCVFTIASFLFRSVRDDFGSVIGKCQGKSHLVLINMFCLLPMFSHGQSPSQVKINILFIWPSTEKCVVGNPAIFEWLKKKKKQKREERKKKVFYKRSFKIVKNEAPLECCVCVHSTCSSSVSLADRPWMRLFYPSAVLHHNLTTFSSTPETQLNSA